MMCHFQKCELCYDWTKDGAGTGVCIQCGDGLCTTAFHVSCAKAYGIKFTPANWPFPVDVICHKHTNAAKVGYFLTSYGFSQALY